MRGWIESIPWKWTNHIALDQKCVWS